MNLSLKKLKKFPFKRIFSITTLFDKLQKEIIPSLPEALRSSFRNSIDVLKGCNLPTDIDEKDVELIKSNKELTITLQAILFSNFNRDKHHALLMPFSKEIIFCSDSMKKIISSADFSKDKEKTNYYKTIQVYSIILT